MLDQHNLTLNIVPATRRKLPFLFPPFIVNSDVHYIILSCLLSYPHVQFLTLITTPGVYIFSALFIILSIVPYFVRLLKRKMDQLGNGQLQFHGRLFVIVF